ncbi:MAG TPA: hypothetical protein VGE52_13170 [Pirellulales bacterium]
MVRTDVLYTKPEFLRDAQAGEDDWQSFLEAGMPAIEVDGQIFVSGADFDAWIHDGESPNSSVDPLQAVWTLPPAAVWGDPCGEFAA